MTPIENKIDATAPICYFLSEDPMQNLNVSRISVKLFFTAKEDRTVANNIENYAVNFGSFVILDVNNISARCILCNP